MKSLSEQADNVKRWLDSTTAKDFLVMLCKVSPDVKACAAGRLVSFPGGPDDGMPIKNLGAAKLAASVPHAIKSGAGAVQNALALRLRGKAAARGAGGNGDAVDSSVLQTDELGAEDVSVAASAPATVAPRGTFEVNIFLAKEHDLKDLKEEAKAEDKSLVSKSNRLKLKRGTEVGVRLEIPDEHADSLELLSPDEDFVRWEGRRTNCVFQLECLAGAAEGTNAVVHAHFIINDKEIPGAVLPIAIGIGAETAAAPSILKEDSKILADLDQHVDKQLEAKLDAMRAKWDAMERRMAAQDDKLEQAQDNLIKMVLSESSAGGDPLPSYVMLAPGRDTEEEDVDDDQKGDSSKNNNKKRKKKKKKSITSRVGGWYGNAKRWFKDQKEQFKEKTGLTRYMQLCIMDEGPFLFPDSQAAKGGKHNKLLKKIQIEMPGPTLRAIAPYLIVAARLLKVASMASKVAGIPIPSDVPFLGDALEAVKDARDTIVGSEFYEAYAGFLEREVVSFDSGGGGGEDDGDGEGGGGITNEAILEGVAGSLEAIAGYNSANSDLTHIKEPETFQDSKRALRKLLKTKGGAEWQAFLDEGDNAYFRVVKRQGSSAVRWIGAAYHGAAEAAGFVIGSDAVQVEEYGSSGNNNNNNNNNDGGNALVGASSGPSSSSSSAGMEARVKRLEDVLKKVLEQAEFKNDAVRKTLLAELQ